MRIGVPKEIKNEEHRVGLTPASVRELVSHGHEVLVEAGAGDDIGFDDEHYRAAGAQISPSADEVFAAAQMIVQVQEPRPGEIKRLPPEHGRFPYLHLAPDPAQATRLLAAGW